MLDQIILHPQGGGQPFDTGSIEAVDGTIKFCVTDVRTKSGVVSSKVLDHSLIHKSLEEFLGTFFRNRNFTCEVQEHV